jgi:hypothetical protein
MLLLFFSFSGVRCRLHTEHGVTTQKALGCVWAPRFRIHASELKADQIDYYQMTIDMQRIPIPVI